MALKLLHDPQDGPLRVAALMSGSGTNIRRLLELEREIELRDGKSPFETVVIFSNDARSKAVEIGTDFTVPVVVNDMRAWYKRRNAPPREMIIRAEYDKSNADIIKSFGVKAAAFGGYMAVATKPLLDAFIGVNVHPADLAVKQGNSRKFTGDHAVLDAILAGEKYLRSSTHIVESQVDMGRLFFISSPVEVNIPAGANFDDRETMMKIAQEHQERLKEKGDWVIFPLTIEEIARGKFAVDEKGLLHYEGLPIPDGVRLV